MGSQGIKGYVDNKSACIGSYDGLMPSLRQQAITSANVNPYIPLLLTHCGIVTPYGDTFNIASDNGLLPDSTRGLR